MILDCLYLVTSLHLFLESLVREDGSWKGDDEKSISHVN